MPRAYLILFDVGIPNSVCGYTLVPQRVLYYFQVTVTLTFGLNSRKNHVGSISPILFVGWIPNSVSEHTLGSRITVTYYLRVTLTLTSGLSSKRIVSCACLTFDLSYWNISCLWGQNVEMIIFWWPWLNFQGHYPLKFYLMSKRLDFHQTCIDALFGRGKELTRFWWPWSCFHGHTSTLQFQMLTKFVFPHAISWNKWWISIALYI